MKRPFTDTHVRSLKAKAKRYEVADPGSRGLYLRIEPSGTKSWWSVYRLAGKLSRVRLGEYPATGLQAARAAHYEIKASLKKGRDPAAEARQHKALRRTPKLETGETVSGLVRLYTRSELAKMRSGQEAARVLAKHVLPVIGNLPVKSVTRPVIAALLDEAMERGPHAANRLFSLLRRILNFAMDRGVIDINPGIGMSRPHREVARDRVLTDGEIRALWHGAEDIFHRFAFRWLLASGCRKGELLGARWAELRGNEWTLPAERVKLGRVFVTPVSSLMQGLLGELPRVGEYLLPGAREDKPMSHGTLNKALDRLIEAQGLAHFTVHDLRRTARTRWSKERIAYDVAEMLIGHQVGTRVGRAYDRYNRWAERAEALEKWAQRLALLTDTGAGVTPISRGG